MIKCKKKCKLCKEGLDKIGNFKVGDKFKLKLTANMSVSEYNTFTGRDYLKTNEELEVIFIDDEDDEIPYKVASESGMNSFWVNKKDIVIKEEPKNDDMWC